MSNLMLPGNPRYQPESLKKYFGYDNIFRTVAMVEIATMQTLAEIGVIPAGDITDLTPEVEQKLLAITTSEVDDVERQITKHDIRAWVRIAQGIIGPRLARWVHVPLTSYDALDTARALQYMYAHREVVRPLQKEVALILTDKARKFSGTLQIGRTHGQHALPITVGFWLATILFRFINNAMAVDHHGRGICVGKISGAVGAYNAQVALDIRCHGTFEGMVLSRLGLGKAPISTQILPPEPIAYYLFSCVMLSSVLGQFGRDCRHLMRTEIGEICEPFEQGQVGSSTMAAKRNPLTFENLEGMWLKNKNELGKVMDTLISEHQRDLVGSCVYRDYPTIVVNLVQQLNTLLRKDKNGKCFLERISVDEAACQRNFRMSGDLILAEPMYLALQMAGYQGDAHEVINHQAVPLSKERGISLYSALELLVMENESLRVAFVAIPDEVHELFQHPEDYTGKAQIKALEICDDAERYCNSIV